MNADFIVIGAGIAGASVAYELSSTASVIVLEGEAQPGFHSTGRSAALFSEIYGNATVRALSRASREFLLSPPSQFATSAFLKPRGTLFLATSEQIDTFDLLSSAPDVQRHTRRLTANEAHALVPILKRESIAQAMLEPGAFDIDVDALHQGYLRGMKARGASLCCSSPAQSIERLDDLWRVTSNNRSFEASVLINAAGAWADEIAKLAGVQSIGLEPRRRTALLVDAPPDVRVDAWPMVMDVGDTFYFKPDAGQLLLSPADETPTAPCDAQPDDLDVAIAVDRVEQATTLVVKRVRHQWAGLRSFVADRSPVAGFDSIAPGFFWLAAQGGYGIQTAPALARIAATLAFGATQTLDSQLVASVSPARLRS